MGALTVKGCQMAFAFDSLAFAKRLRDGGVPNTEAEVHAEAAREFIMAELVTKSDLEATRSGLEASMESGRRELQTSIDALRRDMETSIDTVRRELQTSIDTLRRDTEASLASTRTELKAMIMVLSDDMKAMRREFAAALEYRDSRLLLRVGIMMGSMLTLGFGIMALLIKH